MSMQLHLLYSLTKVLIDPAFPPQYKIQKLHCILLKIGLRNRISHTVFPMTYSLLSSEQYNMVRSSISTVSIQKWAH